MDCWARSVTAAQSKRRKDRNMVQEDTTQWAIRLARKAHSEAARKDGFRHIGDTVDLLMELTINLSRADLTLPDSLDSDLLDDKED